MVGPGVANNGIDTTTWSDHTDLRPTMMHLLGRQDDYTHDGRVLVEDLTGFAVPAAVRKAGGYRTLAPVYKQLNAPFGAFDMAILRVSTRALASGSTSDDSTYATREGQITDWTNQRDAVATQIKGVLEAAAFGGTPISQQQAQSLAGQAQSLINTVQAAAS